MTKIILIRHCQTQDNKKGLMQGYHNDSDFTQEGNKQLEKICNFLKKENIKEIYCSDLGRAVKTAKAISKKFHVNINIIKNLREADIGDWKNMPVKEAIQKWIDYYNKKQSEGMLRENIRPPNGENAWDHKKRLKIVIQKIISKHSNDTVVIVGHSGTNKVLLGIFSNKDPDDFYSTPQDNACINIIETDGNNSNIILLNHTKHLNEKN